MHRCGALHWTMGNLREATLIKILTLPPPVTINSSSSSTRVGAHEFPPYPHLNFNWLDLYRLCADSLSCYEFKSHFSLTLFSHTSPSVIPPLRVIRIPFKVFRIPFFLCPLTLHFAVSQHIFIQMM